MRFHLPLPSAGLRSDLPQVGLPLEAACDLTNLVYRGGKLLSRPGYVKFGSSLSQRPSNICSFRSETGVFHVVVGTTSGWWHWDLSTKQWVDITQAGNGLNGIPEVPQVFRVFHKNGVAYLIGVNGFNDVPKKWDESASTYSDWSGPPPKARCMAVLANRCVLGNVYDTEPHPTRVVVSSFNDFESGYDSVQVVEIIDTPGPIVEIRELGNLNAVIYKEDSIYLITAQAALAPFRISLKEAWVSGPVSPKAVVPTPRGHYYFSLDGHIVFFDGVRSRVLRGPSEALLAATVDFSRIRKAFGFYDARRGEVWFIYADSTSEEPNRGVVVRLQDESVWPVRWASLRPVCGKHLEVEEGTTIGDLTMTLGEISGTVGDLSAVSVRPVLCDVGGQVYRESGNSDDGTAIDVIYESGLIPPFGGMRSTLRSVELLARRNGGTLTVKVGKSEGGESPAYTNGKSADLSQSGRLHLPHREAGRYFSLRLEGPFTTELDYEGAYFDVVQVDGR